MWIESGDEPARLVLRPVQRVAGKVVDATGKPVPGVRFEVHVRGVADGEDLASEHYDLGCLLCPDASDADGRFAMLLPSFAADVQLVVASGSLPVTGGGTFAWDPANPAAFTVVVHRQ
jgi:hypothetical protein